MSDKEFNMWDLLKWVLKYVRPYWLLGVLLLVGLVLNQAFESFLPYSFKFILDDAIVPKDYKFLFLLLAGLGVGAVFFSIVSFFLDVLYARVGNNILKDLRAAVFNRIQSLDMKFHSGMSKGEIISRCSSDIDAIESVIITTIPQGIVSFFGLLFSAIMLFSLEWRMATVAFIGIVINILSVKLLEKRATRTSLAKKEKLAELTTVLEENLHAQTVIRGFNLKEFTIKGYFNHLQQFYKVSMRSDVTSYIMERMPNVGMLFVTVLIIAIGAVMAIKEMITIGTLVSFQALLAGVSASVYGITWVLPYLIDSTTSAMRIEQLISAKPAVDDCIDAQELEKVSEKIDFCNVNFGYTEDQKNLHEFNISVKQGWSVAFVGPSGSGKSTVLNLVQRMYDPDSGDITIDSANLRKITQHSLHKHMSVVFQENFLFNVSIRDNIRMGKLDATDEEIIEAAKLADSHEFIMNMPDGYDTIAGDRGGRFSGGQRQRIAIARAIIRNPSILILDEATSALDPATESSISKTIEKLAHGRIILSVTHRLAPITKCDCIYVLDKGKLVESGRHDTLLHLKGLYSQLWEKQSGFSINEEGFASITSERLRKFPLFNALDDSLLKRLSKLMTSEKFSESREIVRQGDEGDKFYIIVRGKAEIRHCDSNGKEDIISVLSDGDHFGEIALLKNVPRTASVISRTPSIVLTLQRDHFHAMVDESPEIKEHLDNELNKRLAEINKR
jgi:ATP-binding cassette subfamily B protein